MLRQFFEYARYLKPVMKLFIAALAAGALAAAASGFGFPLMIAKVFPVVLDNTQIPPELQNIIAHLGTQEFPRIKIGTGAPSGGGAEMIDWVIGVPSQAERKILVESFENAVKAAEDIIENGCQKAMND